MLLLDVQGTVVAQQHEVNAKLLKIAKSEIGDAQNKSNLETNQTIKEKGWFVFEKATTRYYKLFAVVYLSYMVRNKISLQIYLISELTKFFHTSFIHLVASLRCFLTS